jgi:photosynthetic reaction center cytochrome c subunit
MSERMTLPVLGRPAWRFGWLGLLGAAVLVLAGCERPPVTSVQQGFRGTGMVQIDNPRIVAAREAALPAAPADAPQVGDAGPKARDVFQNVKVLGDLSVGEFTRHMNAITAWVSPEQGCAYCHNLQNLADDSKYQKIVSRRMIEMTRHLNAEWKPHVGDTGVTCWTCHRGANQPALAWFKPVPGKYAGPGGLLGNDFGQNKASANVGLTSLPYDPLSAYLVGNETIRVNAPKPLPNRVHVASIQQAEGTYALMVHMSEGLGVNCTFCHNSHSFQTWDQPARVKAWHGIRMARETNNDYVLPLDKLLPAAEKGPLGDIAKVNCATCHQGQHKPVGGKQMAKEYPGLMGVSKAMLALLPEAIGERTRSVMYFGVGSPVLEGAQAKALDQLVATMASDPRARATISGYHSASGDLASNQELAKQRAFTVRDAMLAAGVAEGRVVLAKPVQAEANLAGEDATARRVEVTLGR